jgi:molybdopterin synthase sulfur carrier subunit
VPVVCLHGPLKRLAGNQAEHVLDGETVAAVLAELEARQPALAGWVRDERGRIRRHINVFVGGEPSRGETPVGAGDRVEVLPAISGGSA